MPWRVDSHTQGYPVTGSILLNNHYRDDEKNCKMIFFTQTQTNF